MSLLSENERVIHNKMLNNISTYFIPSKVMISGGTFGNYTNAFYKDQLKKKKEKYL